MRNERKVPADGSSPAGKYVWPIPSALFSLVCNNILLKNIKIMSKYCCLLLIILLMLCFALPVSADTVLNSADFGSIAEALDAIPADAGNIDLLLAAGVFAPDDARLEIPADRGITALRMLPADRTAPVSLPDLERICANGIPLEIGEGLEFENGSIYGGACVSKGETVIESSSVTVAGTVGFVFGGGFAENGGTSIVKKTAVTVSEGALVYYEVFGAGHAYGEGSRVSSDSAAASLDGTTDYLLGAGFAEDGGHSECGETSLLVSESGNVAVALFGGGSAAGAGSLSSVGNTLARLSGKAHWTFPGDFAFGGGETRLDRAGRVEILSEGSVVNAYQGSFASDPGSKSSVNTAELMNCGTAELVIDRGQASDGGSVNTMITAVFPCSAP